MRDFSKFKVEAFKADTAKITVIESYIDSTFNDFQNKFAEAIAKHTPLKKLSNQDLNWKQHPWITMDMKKTDVLNRKFLATKN